MLPKFIKPRRPKKTQIGLKSWDTRRQLISWGDYSDSPIIELSQIRWYLTFRFKSLTSSLPGNQRSYKAVLFPESNFVREKN